MKNWWYFDIIGYVKLVLFMPKKSLFIIIILGLLVVGITIVFWQFGFKEKQEPSRVLFPEAEVSEDVEDTEPGVCGDGKITGEEECDPNAIVIGCPAFEVCSLICVCEGKIEEEEAEEAVEEEEEVVEEEEEVLQEDKVCGNRKCEEGEDEDNCCIDCGCPDGQFCKNRTCQYPECEDVIDCDDRDICTIDACVNPNSANAYCRNEPISVCESGDLCCPSNCYALRIGGDADCTPHCGNGQCEISENCDNCAKDCVCKETQHCGPEEWGAFVNGCVDNAICGDGKCTTSLENCDNCSRDCGCDEEETCDPGHSAADSYGCYFIPEPICGDGSCDTGVGEDCYTCGMDCVCTGLTMCDPGPGADAIGCVPTGAICGNGMCETSLGEHCMNCIADCACWPPDECIPGMIGADPKGCITLL